MDNGGGVSVWRYNLFIAVLVLLYCRTAVALGDFLVRNNFTSLLVSRKLVHFCATCVLLFWPLFDESDSWSWRLHNLACIIYSAKMVIQGLIFPNPNDPEVKAMSRTGDPKELCIGPLMFGLALLYVGNFAFKKEMATFVMASLGFGDGIAPVVGQAKPWGRYVSLGGESKTLTGSLGVFLGTIFGYFVLQAALGVPEKLDINRLVGVATTATLAEAVSGPYDNLAITLAVYVYVRATNL